MDMLLSCRTGLVGDELPSLSTDGLLRAVVLLGLRDKSSEVDLLWRESAFDSSLPMDDMEDSTLEAQSLYPAITTPSLILTPVIVKSKFLKAILL